MTAKPAPGTTLVVPIFPLPDVTLFPGTMLPLHIFEARYRAMVTDAIEYGRRLAMVQFQPGYEAEYAGKPAVRAVAGVGEIVGAERLPTGRYNIVLRGQDRIRIRREVPADTLYRLALAERLQDVAPTGDVGPGLGRIRASCRRLLKILERRADLLDPVLADGVAPGVVVDRVAAAVVPSGVLRQELLETLDVGRRVERLASALEDLVIELRGGRE